jgi:hypothetical protein
MEFSTPGPSRTLELVTAAVWDWIISVNNGHGLDTMDLAGVMEELGAPCPEELREED